MLSGWPRFFSAKESAFSMVFFETCRSMVPSFERSTDLKTLKSFNCSEMFEPEEAESKAHQSRMVEIRIGIGHFSLVITKKMAKCHEEEQILFISATSSLPDPCNSPLLSLFLQRFYVPLLVRPCAHT